ncbi:MAG: histidine phosphatase family protein [Proteobacteria bacterium]|nr:histidine phosphatase family protein [Pseudomonadota bacterium]
MDRAFEGKRLYLMRHGKTYEPHADSRTTSPERDPELPLLPDGIPDVEATAKALAGVALDAAYCSTFRRARETARRVAEPHGLEVHAQAGLEELRIYPGEGGTMLDTARRYVEISRALRTTPPHEIPLGSGESLGSVLDNAVAALRACLEGSGRRILVVAHGGINRLLLTQLLGLPLERFTSIDQEFACVNAVEFVRGGRPWVRALNASVRDPFKTGDIGF